MVSTYQPIVANRFILHWLPYPAVFMVPFKLPMIVDDEKREPPIVEECPDLRMTPQDFGNRLLGRLDGHGQP